MKYCDIKGANGLYYRNMLLLENCDDDVIEPHVEYTEQDIKITRWRGGNHYYAKVGHIDVEDDFGKVKWNTEKQAREMAVKYMHDLNLQI